MASSLNQSYSLLTFFALFSLLINPAISGWSKASATWYGNPTGAGSNGGACGYTNIIESAPFKKMVAAGGSSLFKSGKGCGACYEVKCKSNPLCSGKPVTVTITDRSPGDLHFDLSGTAFGALAKPGKANKLRDAGKLEIQYKRVQCHYPGFPLAFHVDSGSNPHYFSTAIEYEGGDGDLAEVKVRNSTSGKWLTMQQSWGAIWKIDSCDELTGPLSIQLKSSSGKSLVAKKVIPAKWKAGKTYRSNVNFG